MTAIVLHLAENDVMKSALLTASMTSSKRFDRVRFILRKFVVVCIISGRVLQQAKDVIFGRRATSVKLQQTEDKEHPITDKRLNPYW